ncbi:FHA domain-containing protein DDL-like isoform X2 [Durio zibethinus]|uniref:FHA domain-containing protein DDL-like isoform X2 n=1 Tax=Durio zibethinus TaxID=66656 RepID=A0A6P5WLE3_DURZI|nr:FHA domain-containing protein DDL-like isoform X2 [Durio zibethinus]
MGRNSSNYSESPVRRRGSPHRRSPSHRERSPARHKSLHKGSSPVREKSPSGHRSSHRDHSLEREKHSGHTKSPKHASPCSPSPRTKRLRRAQAEKEVEKAKDREYERNHSRGSEKSIRKERASGKERISKREMGGDKRERRSGRDDTNSKSGRGRHERSISPSDLHHRSRHRSRSPASNSRARDECDKNLSFQVTNLRGAEQGGNDEDDSVANMKAAEEALEAKQKQKPTFELSGKLAAETNRVRGVTLLFNEPPDARKPNIRWRLYVFKAGEVLNEPLYIHRQSCYLFGRERRVADIPTDHPSCSKQHAVIQFQQVEKEQPDGTLTKQVRPYIMDLGSTNKTFINDNPIEPQRYYELFEKDTIKFAESMFYCMRTLPSDGY